MPDWFDEEAFMEQIRETPAFQRKLKAIREEEEAKERAWRERALDILDDCSEQVGFDLIETEIEHFCVEIGEAREENVRLLKGAVKRDFFDAPRRDKLSKEGFAIAVPIQPNYSTVLSYCTRGDFNDCNRRLFESYARALGGENQEEMVEALSETCEITLPPDLRDRGDHSTEREIRQSRGIFANALGITALNLLQILSSTSGATLLSLMLSALTLACFANIFHFLLSDNPKKSLFLPERKQKFQHLTVRLKSCASSDDRRYNELWVYDVLERSLETRTYEYLLQEARKEVDGTCDDFDARLECALEEAGIQEPYHVLLEQVTSSCDEDGYLPQESRREAQREAQTKDQQESQQESQQETRQTEVVHICSL